MFSEIQHKIAFCRVSFFKKKKRKLAKKTISNGQKIQYPFIGYITSEIEENLE